MLSTTLRLMFGVAGALVLIGALILVFPSALGLLGAPVEPYIPSLVELFGE
jgi:hypothetical protein